MKNIFLFLFLFSVTLSAQSHETVQYHCGLCHACETPTKVDPCLKLCPREEIVTVFHSHEEAPDEIKLDNRYDTRELYSPVYFSHYNHSEMSSIAGGCEICHHYNPPGRIAPCSACHEVNRLRTDISKPDLKGAFHQQCLGCHDKWSERKACSYCHFPNGKKKAKEVSKKGYKSFHPKITSPKIINYETDYDDGKNVTFLHNDHNRLFGLKCVDCHSEKGCVKCHNEKKNVIEEEEDLHDKCGTCHDTEDDCERCHSQKKKTGFNHYVRTGFPLKKYHSKASCVSCHLTKKFSGLKKECNNCHKGWTPENFKHEVTGLKLDDNHVEFDCEECHADNNYLKKDCGNCHEDYKYPEQSPGAK